LALQGASVSDGEIATRLAAVHARIEAAAHACGRSPADIALVAVSKKKPPEAIREAYAAGQRAFGENYAQELADKAVALADLTEVRWHFIGHLQSNKAKVVAKYAHVMHAVDNVSLVRELAKRTTSEGRGPLDVLVEVKLSHEPTKHGVRPEEMEEVLAAIEKESALRLRGLMTMPPPDDLALARTAFSTLVSLANLHGGVARLPELSMGMTADLEVAIACGATMVRVGTAIFGDR
jgi:PLP dependent protein